MIASWFRQRQRVNHLSERLAISTRSEMERRLALKAWTVDSLFRFETALWISVTGAIWMSRRKNKDEDQRGNLAAEILASFWIMQRWRRLFSRASNKLTPDSDQKNTRHNPAPSPSSDENKSKKRLPDS